MKCFDCAEQPFIWISAPPQIMPILNQDGRKLGDIDPNVDDVGSFAEGLDDMMPVLKQVCSRVVGTRPTPTLELVRLSAQLSRKLCAGTSAS